MCCLCAHSSSTQLNSVLSEMVLPLGASPIPQDTLDNLALGALLRLRLALALGSHLALERVRQLILRPHSSKECYSYNIVGLFIYKRILTIFKGCIERLV